MTNIPGEAVLKDTEFPGWVIDQTRDIGDMGGSGEPAINSAAQTFVLYLAPTDGVIFDQVRVLHEGVGPDIIASSSSGTGSVAANSVEFDLYKIPKGTTISAGMVAANKIATQIAAAERVPTLKEFDFKTSLVSRRLKKGDRLVLRVASLLDQSSSSSSDVASTTISEVSVNILGRRKIG